MTSPTTVHTYGQMQHNEYQAQAANRVPVQKEPKQAGDGMIMGKVANLLQSIREQLAQQPSEEFGGW